MQPIFSLILLAVSALLFTLAFTPVCRLACTRLGWVDHPGHRKVHRTPVPRTGGIAILAGYAFAFLILFYSPLAASRSVAAALPGVWALLPAVLVAFATGLLDDVLGLKPWMKLLGQVIAAALAFDANVQINAVAGHSIAATWWPLPLTVFWLVACSNAFNLIDGLDGLAAGVGLFATATAFLSAVLHGNYALALATAPLFGALLGFLPFNFNRASIFMGDCGSVPVGFLLGCFGIIWTQKSATLLGMTAPLIALAIPLLDTTLSVARRFLRRQPLFGADRGHIHHRLLARGFTPRRVAYILYASAGILAGLSLLLSSITSHVAGIALLTFCGIVGFSIQYLGYEEFDAARRILFGDLFLRVLNARLSIREFEHSVRRAQTVEQCWDAVLDTSRSFGFREVSIQLPDRRLAACLDETDLTECWHIKIPLNGVGHLDLSVPFTSSQPPTTITALVASLRRAFAPRLHDLILRTEAVGRLRPPRSLRAVS